MSSSTYEVLAVSVDPKTGSHDRIIAQGTVVARSEAKARQQFTVDNADDLKKLGDFEVISRPFL